MTDEFAECEAEFQRLQALPELPDRFHVKTAEEFLNDDSIPAESTPVMPMAMQVADFLTFKQGYRVNATETARQAAERILAKYTAKATGETEHKPLSCGLSELLAAPSETDWLLEDELERGVIALMVGPRGSYKSFKALDWAMRVATTGKPVYVVSAEGGDFDRRALAWLKVFAPDTDPATVPLRIVQRRLTLNSKEGIEEIRQDCVSLKIKPALFVLDTFSKLSGGLDENDNSQVKQFIGLLDNGLKRVETGFGATVLLIAHTGHSDKSRARGASALGADTDAEYIMSRDAGGVIELTRERFKSSPELPPLVYKPRIVDLERADKSGRPVTSVVLERAERPAGAKSTQIELTGTIERPVYDAVCELAGLEPAEITEVIALARSRIPAELGKDGELKQVPNKNLIRAIRALARKKRVHVHGEKQELVSLIRGEVSDASEFD